ncbi:MAG: amidohydrolase family protein [Oscillospiraceae bacterium]|nr:amidohydrolase family protein [Oscillospiraceae bacterium]
MKVYEGAILTCDEKDNVFRYLAEDGGKIVFTGNELPAKYENAERIFLGKRALIPSFVDSHIHFASFATFLAGLNVADAESNSQILEMIRDFVKGCGDKMIIAFGASPHSVAEKHFVTRKQLDEVCPDKPLFMVKYDGHTCVVNTKLLEKIRKKAKNLRGYHEETGEMNQEAFFAVSDYVTNSVSIPKLLRNMQKAADFMASRGIGMIHTVSGVGFPLDIDVDMEKWFGKGLSNGLQLRVFFQTMDVEKVKRRNLPRIGGCFATALDGCFGSEDAAMLLPYEGSENKGVLYYSDEKVADFCKKANRAGLQIEMHAIGDAAFDQATKALKAALDDFPRKDHRHTIIHACLPTEEGIRICGEYGIGLAVQSAFIDWPQEPNDYLERILGERAKKLNPFRTYDENKIVMSVGSDGPCTAPDPINWLYKLCNNGEESLPVQKALRICTANGYHQTFDEKERGSLEPGKIADMVILSENPFEMEAEKLCNLKVEKLLLGGEDYKPLSENPVKQVLRGVFSK